MLDHAPSKHALPPLIFAQMDDEEERAVVVALTALALPAVTALMAASTRLT